MRRVLLVMITLLPVPAALALCNPFEPKTLAGFEASLASDFTAFPHLSPEELVGRASSAVLLDVREPAEFAMSHLEGAINVAPDASPAEIRRLLAGLRKPSGARPEVIFYCTVGYRSSKLAERVRRDLAADGIVRIANLRGGILAWANRGLTVVDSSGPTAAVHPYNECFAPMLKPPSAAAR